MLREKTGRQQLLTGCSHREAPGAVLQSPLPINKREMNMTDFARVPTGHQATRLNWFEARLRQLCYLLAQKGNPEAKA
nr:MAG TPA: hypothetical protein [Caudoviricetes sp.]